MRRKKKSQQFLGTGNYILINHAFEYYTLFLEVEKVHTFVRSMDTCVKKKDSGKRKRIDSTF